MAANSRYFKILEMEPSSDPLIIKRAYAAMTRKYHPEENPEKWQEMHEAYEALMAIYSKKSSFAPTRVESFSVTPRAEVKSEAKAESETKTDSETKTGSETKTQAEDRKVTRSQPINQGYRIEKIENPPEETDENEVEDSFYDELIRWNAAEDKMQKEAQDSFGRIKNIMDILKYASANLYFLSSAETDRILKDPDYEFALTQVVFISTLANVLTEKPCNREACENIQKDVRKYLDENVVKNRYEYDRLLKVLGESATRGDAYMVELDKRKKMEAAAIRRNRAIPSSDKVVQIVRVLAICGVILIVMVSLRKNSKPSLPDFPQQVVSYEDNKKSVYSSFNAQKSFDELMKNYGVTEGDYEPNDEEQARIDEFIEKYGDDDTPYLLFRQELLDEGRSLEFANYASFQVIEYRRANSEATSEEETESTENEEPERTGSKSQ